MSNRHAGITERELISRLRQFLRTPTIAASRLPWLVERITNNGWPAVFFGGLLRDLSVQGDQIRPRDFDIVVSGPSNDELYSAFRAVTIRRTRFGGLVLDLGPFRADVWSLQSTWAFQTDAFTNHSLYTLPRTTFLNVEAIAVDLTCQRIFDAGFLKAIAMREMEVNFEPNPFPELCVVRSLVTAANLSFSLGKNLVHYLLYWSSQFGMADLLSAQLSHYGRIVLPARQIENSLTLLKAGEQTGFVVSHL